MEKDTLDLHTVIGEVDITNYCGSYYYDWEKKVATPALEKLGYTDIWFYNIEADSFGPLIRGVRCQKDGKSVEMFYG